MGSINFRHARICCHKEADKVLDLWQEASANGEPFYTQSLL